MANKSSSNSDSGIGTVILLVVVLVGAIVISFVQFALLSLPAWSIGIIISAVLLINYKDAYIDETNLSSGINKSITYSYDGNKINYKIETYDYKSSDESKERIMFSIAVCSVITLVILLVLTGISGYFSNFILWVNKDMRIDTVTAFAFSCVASVIVICLWYFIVNSKFNSWIYKSIEERISDLNLSTDVTGELASLKLEIRELCDKINIPLNEKYIVTINDFVNLNSETMFLQTTIEEFKRKIKIEVNNAKKYRKDLTNAIALRGKADKAYEKAGDAVYKNGSDMLLRQLQNSFETLNSSVIKDLICDQKWKEYEDTINLIIAYFDKLKITADKTAAKDENENEENGDQNDNQEMTEQEAYELLMVSDTVTKEEVKKAYRIKITECHPDKFMEQPDFVKKASHEMSVKINKAYKVIMSKFE